jgi:hypothetical protein
MTFSYSAEVPKSAAYDDATVTAPDPVFRKLTDTVEIEYSYRGDPGTIAVAAELSMSSGWHSTVPLGSSEAFSEDSYTGTVSLDLSKLESVRGRQPRRLASRPPSSTSRSFPRLPPPATRPLPPSWPWHSRRFS